MLLTVREDASVLQRQSEGVGEGLNMQNMDIKGRGDRYSWRRPFWICVVLELNNSVLNDEMIEWTLVNASVTIPTRSTSQLLLNASFFFHPLWNIRFHTGKRKQLQKKELKLWTISGFQFVIDLFGIWHGGFFQDGFVFCSNFPIHNARHFSMTMWCTISFLSTG